MRSNLLIPLFLISLVPLVTNAQEQSQVEHGKQVFEHNCAPCHAHGPGNDGLAILPAPTALTVKYRGTLSPYIEERADLANANVLRAFVRNGVVSMPPFRKTEVSDSDIDAIAAYFKISSKESNQPSIQED